MLEPQTDIDASNRFGLSRYRERFVPEGAMPLALKIDDSTHATCDDDEMGE